MREVPQEQLTLTAAVLDALPQAAMLVDADQRIVRVNRRFITLMRLPADLDVSLGASRDRLREHLTGMIDSPEQRQRFLTESATGAPITRIADYHLHDGRTLRRRRTRVLEGERFVGHLWLVEDITREREAEETLYEEVRTLAALADDRAAFAARALHELRTPLATVLSLAELLLDPAGGSLTEEQADFVLAIRRNAHRMRVLTENLPTAAAGPYRVEPRFGEILVHELIDQVALEALQRSGDSGPYIAAECPTGGPPLVADGVLLTGALEELVANAMRFTPDDGRVEIIGRPDGDHWTLQVRDTGIGVPLAYQDEIFDAFVRAPNARRGGFPGTGLGLANALDAVRLHGGTITVRDRENNQGTVFTVRLPVAGPGGARPETTAEGAADDGTGPEDGEGAGAGAGAEGGGPG
ncbi:ATP-binding protein [Streptomyces sp. NPDC090025]|uniref:sensor histidine kinase n=1 Tax=Streptomyces sp. NPDC090025 TaxID=3365922 RepID=UPI0038344612